MVLMIYLLEPNPKPGLVPKEDPFAADIAQAIDEVLKKGPPHAEIDLVIVPSMAVRVVVRRTAAGREPAERNRLTFALASCQYTLGMVDGSPAGMSTGPGDDSYDRMRKRVSARDRPDPNSRCWPAIRSTSTRLPGSSIRLRRVGVSASPMSSSTGAA